MNGCLLCLGPSKEVRECLCGSKPVASCPGDSRQEAGAALRALGGCQNPEVLSLRRPGREHN